WLLTKMITLPMDIYFFYSSRRRHTRFSRDWSSDVCSSDLLDAANRLGQGVTSLYACQTRMRKAAQSSSRSMDSGGCAGRPLPNEIGRASCRGREEIVGGAGSF